MSLRSVLLAGGYALVQLVAAPLVAAQAPLGLGEIYRALPSANPRIAAASAFARASHERVSPARALPDPQLQVGFMNRELPGLGYADVLGMDQIQLMQTFPISGKLGLAGRAASERATAEDARAAEVGWGVRARAAMGFYELYQMDRSIVVGGETLRLLQDLAKVTETMYGVGEGRQVDALKAHVEIARMQEEIIRMEAGRAVALARGNALLARGPGAPLGTPVLLSYPDSLPPIDSLLAEAEAHRPMVQADEAELRAADTAAIGARREIWPDLQVGVQYGQRPMPGGGTDRMMSLMLGVNLPIFARSRQFAMRREAEAMRAVAQANLDDSRAETRGRVGELVATIGRAQRLGALYRTTILPQAQAAVESARSSYRTGAVDFMTLLDDQMTVNRYRLDLIALDAEHGSALAELEMLLGRELFDPTSVRPEAQ